MFYEDLFHEKPRFEKVAVTVKLPDDVSKWAPKVLSELHRQVPAMEEFHATIVLDRVDPNKGVGFGYIVAQPKTINPMMTMSLPKVKIPVIITDWRLSPLDVFYTPDGVGLPLNDRRIREVLLRADAFDAPAPRGNDMGEDVRTMLTPPWENVGQYYNGINSQVSTAGPGSVKTSGLLNALHRTVEVDDIVKVANWVRSTEGRAALHGDEDVKMKYLQSLRLEPRGTLVKESAAHGPVITQYRWTGGPLIMIKTAQPGAFNPQQQAQPAQQAAQGMNPQQQAQVSQTGEATQAPELEVMSPMDLEVTEFKPVDTFGVYNVVSVTGEQKMGWVFPFVLSFEMQKVPVQIFSDGSSYFVASSIPGALAGNNLNLPNEKPQNRGLFYLIKNGRAFAFAPVEIMGEQAAEDGSVMYMCKTILGGNNVQITKVQGIQGAAVMGEGQYGIPADARWLSFKQQTNPLVEDPAQATQRANAHLIESAQRLQQQQAAMQQQQQQGAKGQKKQANLRARIRKTQEGRYSLSGAAFDKIAAEHTQFIDLGDAVWMMALAGVDPDYTREKLASLHLTGNLVDIPVYRELTPPRVDVEDVDARAKLASALKAPFKGQLLKVAAELGDPMIADTLLSLNFLGPKNIHMFIGYMPQLENTLHMLVNMLVASRLGLAEVSEDACMLSLNGIEDVIKGIKLLMLREGNL